jgi:hypothetical protein
MEEVTPGGHLLFVVTAGGVVARWGHHNNNSKLEGVVHDLDVVAHMIDW